MEEVELAAMVLSTAQRRRAGGGDYVRLRRDAYVRADAWTELDARSRHLVRAHEVTARRDEPPLLCGPSAAAVWGLPIIGAWSDEVEVLVPDGAPGSRPGIRRRRTTVLPQGELRSGLLVTSAARTVIDVARTSPESGLAAADHAVRVGLVTQEELRAEALAVPPRAGGRQGAQAVAALADPLAESTGESLSRFGFWQLGFPRPRLQVEFHDAAGFIGRTDAFWEAARLIGEFDGRVKYRVPPNATPDQASKVLWDEKRREDRLRRVVAGVARWTWREALHRERLRAVLIGHGLRPSDQPWFDPVTLELL